MTTPQPPSEKQPVYIPGVGWRHATESRATRRPLFAPGYNDRILMNGGQLAAWRRYLDDNPLRHASAALTPRGSLAATANKHKPIHRHA